MTIASLSAAEASKLAGAGARLIDIRDADEFARERIAGAVHLPLAQIEQLAPLDRPVIFHCRSGMRTAANAARLQAASSGADCYILAGGIDSWRGAGLATVLDRKQPLEIMRQVQLAAGALILLGIGLGFAVAPLFFALSAVVGAGLLLAGASGWCGMADLLRLMPWNRRGLAG